MAAKKDLLLVFDPSFLLQRYKPLKKTKVGISTPLHMYFLYFLYIYSDLYIQCDKAFSCFYPIFQSAFGAFTFEHTKAGFTSLWSRALLLNKQKMIMVEFLDDKMVDHENEDKLKVKHDESFGRSMAPCF